MEIINEILGGMESGAPCVVIPAREEAIRFAILNAKRGDLILLAGKGHEEYEITKEGRRYFSERELVKEAFALRRQRSRPTDVTESEL